MAGKVATRPAGLPQINHGQRPASARKSLATGNLPMSRSAAQTVLPAIRVLTSMYAAVKPKGAESPLSTQPQRRGSSSKAKVTTSTQKMQHHPPISKHAQKTSRTTEAQRQALEDQAQRDLEERLRAEEAALHSH
jgi:hypothetical protein